MTSIKGLRAGVQLPKLSIEILLRQQPPTGGSALLIRVTRTTFAMSTRTGTRTSTTLAVAMGLRHACVYDL